ncbi:MAG: NAD(P)-dependent oxidoreductase [candidate division Zixibacteria bacterium]|nr:NAD(P)-dependent oxidoreductase [candidate division Zixibacteria bacterium]
MTVKTKQKTILVTGGAGYIGSVLVASLLRFGFRVRVIDRLMHGGESLLGFLLHPNFEFIYGDICRPNDVDSALENIDSVVHLAAIVGDIACQANPKLATKINKTASEMLCEKSARAGVRRFVFISTCSNYGKMGDGVSWVDETSSLAPVSLYAELKVGFERFLLESVKNNFEPVCLRFATAYGLSLRPRFDLTVNEFTRDLFLNRKLEIYGEQFWRPYCHTYDLAHACILALAADADKVAGEAFNVGNTNQNFRKKDLVQMILKELPDREKLVSYVSRDEDPRDYRVNCDKIHSTLGFEPTFEVANGISEIITGIKTGLISDTDNPRYRNVE